MKTQYFKTLEQAQYMLSQYIDAIYPNKFQDASSIASLNLVESQRGFAIQRGNYGSYLTNANFAVVKALTQVSNTNEVPA